MPFRAGWKTNQGLDSALIYLQRPRQPDPAQPGLQIPLMQSLHPFQMCRHGRPQGLRQHRHPVLGTLAAAHNDLVALKIHVLCPVRYRRKRPLM